ncbi:glucosylceramidase [Cytophagaceae bacterium 50C-KIRBA]|uniref:Glucosylceramidase n=1 Tax=Aquirufa beregesia TaxID=2516556 RepID=A0ABX0ESC6_9BACT|nr:glycoside hydrolase family 30 beta sandwich domain-containing protein [Aquirufa beregesia]NGZ43301.1 glucosylceramidase [Aquirufa beregesia]
MNVVKANPKCIWMLFMLLIPLSMKGQSIENWISLPKKKQMFQKYPNLAWDTRNISRQTNPINLNPQGLDQTVDGFGYTLTGGSAHLIQALDSQTKRELLQELFGNKLNQVGISVLRISIGASDMDEKVFSYDDVPMGKEDLTLENFSLHEDKKALIPLLIEILSINPKIKIFATPWSPPTWMKDNHETKGGKLQPTYYEVYARYFIRYIQEMKKLGINIHAVTPQNEPLHPGNNPSLSMSAEEQMVFIRDFLGPQFQKNRISTKIICYDHNCDKPEYPITILNDPQARKYVDGSAFHLYNGDISALAQVRTKHPDKNLYFTEQWTGVKGDFYGDFMWHIKNVVIGSMNQGAKTALEWNLANDQNLGPHSPGGCTECLGAITLSQGIQRNVAYYIIAQASSFIPAGSKRIKLNQSPNLPMVAFLRPDKKICLLVQNEGPEKQKIPIQYLNKTVELEIPGSSVSTFIFKL